MKTTTKFITVLGAVLSICAFAHAMNVPQNGMQVSLKQFPLNSDNASTANGKRHQVDDYQLLLNQDLTVALQELIDDKNIAYNAYNQNRIQRLVEIGANPAAIFNFKPALIADALPKVECPAFLLSTLFSNATDEQRRNLVDLTIDYSGKMKLLPFVAASDRIKQQNPKCSLAKTLLEHGADVDAQDTYNMTPLINAVFNGNLPLVQLLLQNNAHVNLVDEGNVSALIVAACKGYADIVQMLLNAGADTTILDDDGFDALHYAQENKHEIVVKMLTEAKTAKPFDGGFQ